MKFRLSIFGLLLFVSALPLLAAPGRFAISTESVAVAVSRSGVEVAPEQVTLPANIVASVANPNLKVRSFDRVGAEHVFARLECATTQQCLPFIVSLHLAQGANPEAVALLNPPVPLVTRPSSVTPVVRSGSAATLMLEGAHVHIRIPVTCMESGAIGQTIRVTSLDRKQIYTARVVRDGVVEGRL